MSRFEEVVIKDDGGEKASVTGNRLDTNAYNNGLNRARGLIDGESCVVKFGQNPDIDSGSGFEYITDNGGTYLPPTPVGGRIHDITSSSASDAGTERGSAKTADSGTQFTLVDASATFVTDGVIAGDALLNDTQHTFAQVTAVTETTLTFAGGIREPGFGFLAAAVAASDSYRVCSTSTAGSTILSINGISGATFATANEWVILNGTTIVSTTTSFRRINRMKTFGGVGASLGNVGTVNATAQTDATITSQIRPGLNQTFQAIYSVPIDKVGYITRWWCALAKKGNASCVVNFRGGTLGGVPYPIQTASVAATGNSDRDFRFVDCPQAAAGGADLWLEADTDTNNTSVTGGFDIVLFDA